jgi:hypothetical protein
VAPAAPPPLFGVPPLAAEALAQEVRAWLYAHVDGLPAGEPITLVEAHGELVPLALGRYRIAARFTAPDGRLIHAVDAHGAGVLDGTGGRPLDPALAAFVVGQQPVLAPLPASGPIVPVVPFRQPARLLRDGLLMQLMMQYTTRVSYLAGNGRSYTRVCRPARKQIALADTDPVLFHLPRWALQVRVRGQVYPLEVYQGAAGAGPRLWVGPTPLAGMVFCPVCGRLQLPAQMVACAACGRRVCARCAVYRTRLGLFRKQFCSSACAESFAASGSMLGWR